MKAYIGIIVAVALIGGGWFWWSSMPHAVPAGSAQLNTMPTSNTTSTTSDGSSYVEGNLLLGTDATSSLGTYLIAFNGMTLYMYTKDTAGVSNCTGPCAVIWPPYTISSAAALQNVQAGIPGKAGAITRADGSMQVTYKGQPLYFYGKDTKSGDTAGQNAGKVWFVVKS
jgi:predicted lipoprotein with Yx(FWY)xxD motif